MGVEESQSESISLPEDADFHFFFPYASFRPNQEKIIKDISDAVASQKNCLLIASNGTGKTIMALSAILPIALRKKKKIIFCARTFTQNGRVVDESKEILKKLSQTKSGVPLGVLSIRGRNEMCVNKTIKRLQLPPNESMQVCSDLRKKKSCKEYYELLRKKKTIEKDLSKLAEIPNDAQDIMEYADQEGVCPYFLSKILIRYVEVVVSNYQWIFEPNIRTSFLESLGVPLSDCIVIMDECHNLVEMATGINSFRLTPYTLRQAQKDFGNNPKHGKIIRFLRNTLDMLDSIKDHIQEETPIDIRNFIQQILNDNGFESLQAFKILLEELHEFAETIQQDKIDQGSITRDFISPIYDFFTQFIEHMEDKAYFPCFTSNHSKSGKSIAIELICLNPRLITDPIFKECFATLSLSGTIHAPTFTQLLGLNEIGRMLKMIKMPFPFPIENIKVISIEGLTTRGESRTNNMYSMIVSRIFPIIQNTPKNVGIFCASYEVLLGLRTNGFYEMVKESGKQFFWETSDSSASENDKIIQDFKKCAYNDSKGAVLLGVCGGRNSEGEDFPGDEMNAVIIVGIPFQRPTPSLEAKIKYYDLLFPGKGREYGYTVPAFQRSNQACGRPIRRMTDRALIVLMDYRFSAYQNYLSDWLSENIIQVPNDPSFISREIISFFSGEKDLQKSIKL